VSNLQTILGLIGGIHTQDELRTISNALRTRWNTIQGQAVQTTVVQKDLKPGDPVSFMARGKKHYGTIKTINAKTCSVKVPTGIPGYEGQPWRVPPGLLTKEASVPEVKRLDEKGLMEEILDCYGGLSPENLSCDGEASRAHIQQKSRELNGRLEVAFRQLGRRVSETEAYDWYRKQPRAV
jgi:hypothetical protein